MSAVSNIDASVPRYRTAIRSLRTNIRRALALILAALVSAATLSACQAAPRADYNFTSARKPALWRVTDPVDGNSGYLFGTIHMLPEGIDWQTPPLVRALAATDRLVKELAASDKGVALGSDASGAFDELVPPLAERLSDEEYERLKELAAKQSLDVETLDRWESWALALLLARSRDDDLALDTGQGVDAVLQKRFQGSSRLIVSLDRASDQLARFDALPDPTQIRLLRLSLSDAASDSDLESEFEAMVNDWLSGKIENSVRSENGPLADPVVWRALIVEPNRDWAMQIGRIMRSGGSPFVAVGAAHLQGDDGIVALLKAQGLLVERIQ